MPTRELSLGRQGRFTFGVMKRHFTVGIFFAAVLAWHLAERIPQALRESLCVNNLNLLYQYSSFNIKIESYRN